MLGLFTQGSGMIDGNIFAVAARDDLLYNAVTGVHGTKYKGERAVFLSQSRKYEDQNQKTELSAGYGSAPSQASGAAAPQPDFAGCHSGAVDFRSVSGKILLYHRGNGENRKKRTLSDPDEPLQFYRPEDRISDIFPQTLRHCLHI